ncbi:unnamed protein product [Nippostrongylus brasiliensis]|uniref:Peptidase S1 domain-containing protein n=1 Tax=Nippostrongylus brasiliensis TaxID=27835 RepID=A0A0N4YJG8_NIPBR|nr:unnamed protein product [Nippostrongylus brasiliensis]
MQKMSISAAKFKPRSRYKSFGGRSLKPHEFPWIVSMINGDDICSGVLISRRHILTAAHCVMNTNDKNTGDEAFCAKLLVRNYRDIRKIVNWRVYLGSSKTSCNFCTEPIIPKQAIFLEAYDECTNENDIAIFEIPETDAEDVSANRLPKGLQVVDVNLVRVKGSIISTVVNRTTGICGGDSGGPLFQCPQKRCEVIGVVSEGSSCELNFENFQNNEDHETSTKDLFTNVRHYLDWICQETGICYMFDHNQYPSYNPPYYYV